MDETPDLRPAIRSQQNVHLPVAAGSLREMPEVFALTATAPEFAYSAWDQFKATLPKNGNTAKAYLAAAKRFATWLEDHELGLTQLTAGGVQEYVESLMVLRHESGGVYVATDRPAAPPTKKLHLSAIRKFLDFCVTNHAIYSNPALSVRLERYSPEGKTPEITVKGAQRLIESIDTSTLVGKRDLAVITTMIYTACRTGAVAKLRVKDFQFTGEQYVLQVQEKGGKHRLIPVRHDHQQILIEYMEAAGMDPEDGNAPLFRSVAGKTGMLTEKPFLAKNMWDMLKRKFKAAGLPSNLTGHSFRVTTITDLIEQGVPLEDVQYFAGHADSRTTKIYSRVEQKVTRNIVERISV